MLPMTGPQAPLFQLECTGTPSGAITVLQGVISRKNPSLVVKSGFLPWDDNAIQSEPEYTFTYRPASIQQPLHESVSYYSSLAGLFEVHQRLLPIVSDLKPEQSKRLTEVIFQHKLVRRLD
jgi:hypothetical protein